MKTPVFPISADALPPQTEEVTCDTFKVYLREITNTCAKTPIDIHHMHFALRVIDQMAQTLKASSKPESQQLANSWFHSNAGLTNHTFPTSPILNVELLNLKYHSRLILDWLEEQV